MQKTYEKEIEVELGGKRETIAVGLKGEWEQDPDGDYFIVTEWDWDKYGLTPDEVGDIEEQIVDEIPAWEDEIQESENEWD